jgi:hypothetical protein
VIASVGVPTTTVLERALGMASRQTLDASAFMRSFVAHFGLGPKRSRPPPVTDKNLAHWNGVYRLTRRSYTTAEAYLVITGEPDSVRVRALDDTHLEIGGGRFVHIGRDVFVPVNAPSTMAIRLIERDNRVILVMGPQEMERISMGDWLLTAAFRGCGLVGAMGLLWVAWSMREQAGRAGCREWKGKVRCALVASGLLCLALLSYPWLAFTVVNVHQRLMSPVYVIWTTLAWLSLGVSLMACGCSIRYRQQGSDRLGMTGGQALALGGSLVLLGILFVALARMQVLRYGT